MFWKRVGCLLKFQSFAFAKEFGIIEESEFEKRKKLGKQVPRPSVAAGEFRRARIPAQCRYGNPPLRREVRLLTLSIGIVAHEQGRRSKCFENPARAAGIIVLKRTMEKLKNPVILWLVIGLIIGIFIGIPIGRGGMLIAPLEPASESNLSQTFSLMVDFGDGKLETFQDVSFGEQETLFLAMQKKLGEEKIDFGFKEYEGLGTLITKIGEKENGTGNEYWQYWVNNRHADVGADQYLVRPGNVILWKFSSYEGN